MKIYLKILLLLSFKINIYAANYPSHIYFFSPSNTVGLKHTNEIIKILNGMNIKTTLYTNMTPKKAFMYFRNGTEICLSNAQLQNTILSYKYYKLPMIESIAYEGYINKNQVYSSITILKNRKNEFAPFLDKEDNIDLRKLLNSTKFKTTEKKGEIPPLGIGIKEWEEFKKKGHLYNNVFLNKEFQQLKMLVSERNMDYILGNYNPEYLKKANIKESDLLILKGQFISREKIDINNIEHWKKYGVSLGYLCTINDQMLPIINIINESIRKNRLAFLDEEDKKYVNFLDISYKGISKNEVIDYFNKGTFDNVANEAHPWIIKRVKDKKVKLSTEKVTL